MAGKHLMCTFHHMKLFQNYVEILTMQEKTVKKHNLTHEKNTVKRKM